ncbi:MAG TPA: ATP-binding cassette domain-containing protein [Kineosporiaceae bacterium]|nr:ATP-binding cassette domain-containing protein [Kineosporiaceae bacterium]
MPGEGEESVVAAPPIEVDRLTKHFGGVHAVADLSFTVAPGRVTGFLGPNGAGKTTTLRILLGLVTPTSGTATIGGRRYAELSDPLQTVGASLEATGFHAGRTARDHLRVLAIAGGLPTRRADEVLALVGLTDSAGRRVGGFSLGMRQRLALAAALLGDPPVLLLDEPANGLDPEGIVWLRGFLRVLAGEGRTVLVSSHVLSEVQQTVDDVIIIARGRLIRQASLAELEDEGGTYVLSPTPDLLAGALTAAGLRAEPAQVRSGAPVPPGDVPPGEQAGALRVRQATPAEVGAVAFRAGVEVHELRTDAGDLESVFLSLTSNGAGPPGTGPGGGQLPGTGPTPTSGQEVAR